MKLDEIYKEWSAAPYGAKNRVIEVFAEKYGVSPRTVRRKLDAERLGSGRTRISGKRTIPDVWIDLVAIEKMRVAQSNKWGIVPRTIDVIAWLESVGSIEPGVLKPGTVDRRLRESGLWAGKPVSRFRESASNEAHYLDFSRSNMIGVVGYDSDSGKYILQVRGNSPIYKNKRGKKFGVWYAGIRDGRSGVRLAKLYCAAGENINMGLDFLHFAWMREPDDHPLYSLPYTLKQDNGAVSRSAEMVSFLDAVGVKIERKDPRNRNALGKIERTWRTLWKNFEAVLLMKYPGRKMDIDTLNGLLYDYLLEEIETLHFGEKRRVIYERDCLAYPRRRFDGDPYVLACRPHRRKVGKDLVYRFENQEFEAPERYYNKWIWLRVNMNGQITGEGEEDGKPFEIKGYKPRAAGDYRRFKDTYRDAIIKRIKTEDAADISQGNIVALKGRTETITVESPFSDAPAEKALLTAEEAKAYIVYQLGDIDSYAQVADLFDDFIGEINRKEAIDACIRAVRSATA